jgi:uncharacterized membrane protein required for colicin V production
MSITLFDGVLIGLMLVSGVLAMIRGFSREVDCGRSGSVLLL